MRGAASTSGISLGLWGCRASYKVEVAVSRDGIVNLSTLSEMRFETINMLVNLFLWTATAVATLSMLDRRQSISWGAQVRSGPAKVSIIATSTTMYPPAIPHPQNAYLFLWMGIYPDNGDLIQSIVGSYSKGQSECYGPNADTAWCISSEVYGTLNGHTNQFVGQMTTAWPDYTNGVTFNYTLIDRSTWLWNQTMHDATTGKLLSTYQKTSGPMTHWDTAAECQGACSLPTTPHTYVNSTIVFETAYPAFPSSLTTIGGATHTGAKTTDGGKTYTIDKITIPAKCSSPCTIKRFGKSSREE